MDLRLESSGGRIEVSRVLEMDSNNLTPKRSVVLVSSINSDLSLSSDQFKFYSSK